MPTLFSHLSALLWVVCAFLSVSHAHAQTSVLTNQAGVNARLDVLGALFTPPAAIGASQARMVFYRAANRDALPGAIGVFVNGRYHTSLVPGGFSQLCLSPGAVEKVPDSSVLGKLQKTITTRSQLWSCHRRKRNFCLCLRSLVVLS